MPLLKRKPVMYHPLPSLAAILQPRPPTTQAAAAAPDQAGPSSSPAPSAPPSKAGKKGAAAAATAGAAISVSDPTEAALTLPAVPPDSTDEEVQLDRLLTLYRDDLGQKRKDAKGRMRENLRFATGQQIMDALAVVGEGGAGDKKKKPKNGSVNGAEPAGTEPIPGGEQEWKIWDRECYYVHETGEIFTDYEAYCNRLQFLWLPVYQCEVTGKSSLSYPTAHASEQREARLLHTRFPGPLKRSVLKACQFQIEGKLDGLADKIYERFVNRFFDDEKVFVDVDGDKYLARIIRTFPPRAASSSTPSKTSQSAGPYHDLATDLDAPNESVVKLDDPMAYFYNVRLIEEGAPEEVMDDIAEKSTDEGDEDMEKEKFEGSVMEVQADKISRDRLNFSRAILKRFIRDCVHRDSAVYSPWLLKKAVAMRYDLPVEMPEDVRLKIANYKDRQMEKRKREREERMGLHAAEELALDADEPAAKRKKKANGKKGEEVSAEMEAEAARIAEEERRRKRPFKVPTEDLLVEYSSERDAASGRIGMRPAASKVLPFGDQFEQFLMTWSFLNVMGAPLKLSPFSLDDFETSLYHSDPSTPAPLLTEIHACLLNALVADISAGNEPVRPLKDTGKTAADDPDSETDYWEGKKGATTETLKPHAEPLAKVWKTRELASRDNRRGWQESLVGCLWDRATLDTLPSYLDNILHMLFEDKPAPTRPTWSTGPAGASGPQGLIISRPDKRYSSLHFTHKLDIIRFLIELAGQTAVVRDYLEESTARLTEVRKEQMDVKREWKRIQAEKLELEPKEAKVEEDDDQPVNGDGDLSVTVKGDAASQSPSIRGKSNGANGTAKSSLRHDDDEDELDSVAPHLDIDMDSVSGPPASSPISEIAEDEDDGTPEASGAGAARRKAMTAAAAERSAQELERKSAITKQRAVDKEKKAGSKHIVAEKKRLMEEEEATERRLHELEYEFRSAIYTSRARPLGTDRYGNKVWWMDGLGSAPLGSGGELAGTTGKAAAVWGTGRIYLQGPEDGEVEMLRLAAGQALLHHWSTGLGPDGQKWSVNPELAQIQPLYLEDRRTREEGEAKLAPGEWGVYDTPESLEAFISYLNPKGVREAALIKTFKQWGPDIEAGMRRRRIVTGLDEASEEDGGLRRGRVTRKAAGEEEGWMNWKGHLRPRASRRIMGEVSWPKARFSQCS